MSIDRIGKGGATPEATGTLGADKASETGKTFEVSRPNANDAASSVSGTQASPLEKLKNGSLDFNGYLDAKIDEATSHLHALPSDQLATIRSTLREQMATDPALVDLVKQATGQTPVPEE